MQAGVRWNFETQQQISGFSGNILRSASPAQDELHLDGFHGFPWKHKRNIVKNKRNCVHVCGIQRNTYTVCMGISM